MNQQQLIIILAVIIVACLAVAGFLLMRKRRSRALRERFGPEYDRVVRKEGDVRRGEDVLAFRGKRRARLKIRRLSQADHSNFASRWGVLQLHFVDDPRGTVIRADQLVTEVMQARGYPMGDFDQRVADISVDHPVVVENYRTAHEIALRHGRGEASTEDLGKAMVHYRSLFDELLDDSIPGRKEARA